MKSFFVVVIMTLLSVKCLAQAYWIYQEAEEYFYGSGGHTQSYENAFWLYKKAAEMGSPDAVYKIAVCYFNGYGVDKSDKKALRWEKKAAKKGQIEAQRDLGTRYILGNVCKKSYRKGLKWLYKAANKGDYVAIQNLQEMGGYSKIVYQFDDK